MGLLDSIIFGVALGVSGAFDKDKKTDKAAAYGAAMGASLGSGRKWTMADSIRLGATINALDSKKEESSGYGYLGSSCSSTDCETYDCSSSYSSYDSAENKYDNLILTSEQEEQLEEAGIDTFDFEYMDDDEKMEALEDAGLDPFDFDMY